MRKLSRRAGQVRKGSKFCTTGREMPPREQRANSFVLKGPHCRSYYTMAQLTFSPPLDFRDPTRIFFFQSSLRPYVRVHAHNVIHLGSHFGPITFACVLNFLPVLPTFYWRLESNYTKSIRWAAQFKGSYQASAQNHVHKNWRERTR